MNEKRFDIRNPIDSKAIQRSHQNLASSWSGSNVGFGSNHATLPGKRPTRRKLRRL